LQKLIYITDHIYQMWTLSFVFLFIDCGKYCGFDGYNSEIHPGITQEFQTAAMRYGHTLVTHGSWAR